MQVLTGFKKFKPTPTSNNTIIYYKGHPRLISTKTVRQNSTFKHKKIMRLYLKKAFNIFAILYIIFSIMFDLNNTKYHVHYTKRFKNEFKKALKQGKDETKLLEVLNVLANGVN